MKSEIAAIETFRHAEDMIQYAGQGAGDWIQLTSQKNAGIRMQSGKPTSDITLQPHSEIGIRDQ